MDTRDFGMLFGNALTNATNVVIAEHSIDGEDISVELIIDKARHLARLAYASQVELITDLEIAAPAPRGGGGGRKPYSGGGAGGNSGGKSVANPNEPASEKQVGFASRLMGERGIEVPSGLAGGSKGVVAGLIEALLANDFGKVQKQLEQL